MSSYTTTTAPSLIGRPVLAGPFALLLILILTCIVYLPALKGTQLWDDDAHITRPELQSLRGLSRIWFDLGATQQYYPLLHTAFWVEHKLWGDSTLGYHVVNVLWHLMAVSLLYLILQRLKIPGALLAAAIFAVHPVMVESVAWISEQKNTLSAVFYLSAMFVYLKFDESRRPSRYFVALALFVLGLLTKTVTATLPAALLVIFWWQRGTLSWKRDIHPLLPFFLLGAIAGLTTAWIERKLIGAQGADFELTFLQRGLLAGRVVWFYLSKLVWPANLIFIYPRWDIDPGIWWQWLFPIATLAMLIALWTLRHTSRAPLAALLFFCGTLFPVLGFLNVFPFIYSFVADHFQYVASLGIIVLAAAGIGSGIARLQQPARSVGNGIALVLVAGLATLSWRQSRMYGDPVTLYQTTIDHNPNSWMAHNNLGSQLAANGDDQAAIEQFHIALRLKPNHVEARSNLGALFTNAGRMLEAIDELQAALAIEPDNPANLNNLGIALTHAGRLDEAIENLQRAVRLQPEYANAHENLGVALTRSGKIPEAIEEFQKTLELAPDDVNAHNNLGMLLTGTGATQEAIAHLEQALQLQPTLADAHNNLGEALRQAGQLKPAIEQYQAAARLKPDFVQAYGNLALALNLANRPNEAIAAAAQAIRAAHSTGQEAIAQQIEEWLKHYRTELERTGDAKPRKSP